MHPIQKKERIYHWYLLSFAVPIPSTMNYVSVFTNSLEQRVTMPMIMAAKINNHLPDSAALLNVSYLGKMTRNEMNPPAPEPKVVVEPQAQYLQGMVAGIEFDSASLQRPINPYAPEDGDEITEDAVQWFNGFAAGQAHRNKIEYGEI
jgi:hypothetical protein